MTNGKKQCLLKYLGYYPGQVDGIWGQASIQATKDLQTAYGLDQDGVFGDTTLAAAKDAVANDRFKAPEPTEDGADDGDKRAPTEAFWDESEFFGREEFRCQCRGKYCDGFPVEPQEELVRVCNEIRRRLGVPVSIVDAGGSGVRCLRHNAAVGGVANSNHLFGKAADLHSAKSPQEMYRVAEEVLGDTGELGLYDWGIHVGVDCAYSRFRG